MFSAFYFFISFFIKKTILGEPESISSKKEEAKKFTDYGYSIKSSFIFRVKFDEIYKYENNEYAIWKVYIRKGKVAMLNLPSFVYDRHTTNKISAKSGFSFYSETNSLKQDLGDQFYSKINTHNYNPILYDKKGVFLLAEAGVVRNIILFEPFTLKEKTLKKLKFIE